MSLGTSASVSPILRGLSLSKSEQTLPTARFKVLLHSIAYELGRAALFLVRGGADFRHQ